MSVDLFDFPHTHYYDSDLRELLSRVTKMYTEYEELLSRFNEIDTEFSEIKIQFAELSKKVDDVYNYIDDIIDERITAEMDAIRAEIAVFEKYIEDKVSAFIQSIDELNQYIGVVAETSKAYTDIEVGKAKLELYTQFVEFEERVESEIARLEKKIDEIGAYRVYSPMRGKMVRFADAVNDLFYGLGRIHGLTNAQYKALRLTNDEYANKHLTNNKYYLRAELELIDHEKKYSSITGKLETVANIDSWQSVTRYGTITNDDYANLNLSNDAYALLEMTNFYYMSAFTA